MLSEGCCTQGDLAVSKFVVPLQCKRVSPGGGIGRRARFRCECSKDVQVRVLSRALHSRKRESIVCKRSYRYAGGEIGRHATLRG